MKHIYFYLLLFLFIACSQDPKPQMYEGNALGTTFSMQFFYDKELELAHEIDSTFNVLNQSLSTYISTSDISHINQGDSSVVVDDQFITNFSTAKRIFNETDGFFDPSVGLLVNAYGFGPLKYNLDMNNDLVLDSLMQYVGFDKFQIKTNKTLDYPVGAFLDFNAIAKGYVVDRLGALLEKKGVQHYLIEVGGELVANGVNKTTNQSWRVGIEKPDSELHNRGYNYIIELGNYGMATSGNYRKFSTDSQGNKFVHTINPKTGKSEATDVISASVLAPTCMEADAYATAFMAMGAKKSKAFLAQNKTVHALLYIAVGDQIEIEISEGFKALLVE